MMRRPAAIATALLTLAALTAAKPVPPMDVGPGDAREAWRGRGISLCVADLRAVPALTPDDLESVCGCAVDRYLERQDAAPLPEIAPGRFRNLMGGQLMACTARLRPERLSDVGRHIAAPPERQPEPVVAPSPPLDLDQAKPPVGEEPPAGADEGGSGGFWNWLSGLGLPAWLTGLSLSWMIAIGILVVGLLILAVRRRDPRKDLSAPPSTMRRTTHVAPRRPDLPR